MFDVWLLHLLTNSVPGATETGHNWPPGYPYLIRISAGPASGTRPLTSCEEEGGVRKRTVDNGRRRRAVLCFLGNSQSAIRAATNGKRERADPANLNTRRGPEVGAGRVLGERSPVVRVSGLLRRDPAASGDTSDGEPTKGKHWPTAEPVPRAPALRSGRADRAAGGGGSWSRASVLYTEVQPEDQSGPGWSSPNTAWGDAGRSRFLRCLHGRSEPSAYLYGTLTGVRTSAPPPSPLYIRSGKGLLTHT